MIHYQLPTINRSSKHSTIKIFSIAIKALPHTVAIPAPMRAPQLPLINSSESPNLSNTRKKNTNTTRAQRSDLPKIVHTVLTNTELPQKNSLVSPVSNQLSDSDTLNAQLFLSTASQIANKSFSYSQGPITHL